MAQPRHGDAMSRLEQLGKDHEAAKGYLYEFERKMGKRPSDRLRSMLIDAFMAGCGRVRQEQAHSPTFEELLRGGRS